MKYRVINEIMHTTRLSNIKQKTKDVATGPSSDGDKGGSSGSGKADLLMSRDLHKYMNQLKYAKLLCDRRMKGFDNGFIDDVEHVEDLVEREAIIKI